MSTPHRIHRFKDGYERSSITMATKGEAETVVDRLSAAFPGDEFEISPETYYTADQVQVQHTTRIHGQVRRDGTFEQTESTYDWVEVFDDGEHDPERSYANLYECTHVRGPWRASSDVMYTYAVAAPTITEANDKAAELVAEAIEKMGD